MSKMNASEAKQRVLAVWPDAMWHKAYGCVSAHSYIGKNGYNNLSGDEWWEDEDAAWIDAASRLPATVEAAGGDGEKCRACGAWICGGCGSCSSDCGCNEPDIPCLCWFEEHQVCDICQGITGNEVDADVQLKSALEENERLRGLLREAFIVMSGGEGSNQPFDAERWSKAVLAVEAAVTGEQP